MRIPRPKINFLILEWVYPLNCQFGNHITDINQIYIIDCFIALSSVVEDRGQEFGFSS